MKNYTNCSRIKLEVENHPNKIEYIEITDYYKTHRYDITIG